MQLLRRFSLNPHGLFLQKSRHKTRGSSSKLCGVKCQRMQLRILRKLCVMMRIRLKAMTFVRGMARLQVARVANTSDIVAGNSVMECPCGSTSKKNLRG